VALLPLAAAFLPFITPNPTFNLLWGKDFCLPDEETTQRKMGGKMRVDGWTVEVDVQRSGNWVFFFFSFLPQSKTLDL